MNIFYRNFPVSPGVYSMKNAAHEIIYVGKAGNLKRRVSSYFLRPHDSRIEALVHEIAHINYQETDSALEALILEAQLIKKYEPKYNIKEKDDKSFLFVEITRDAFPRVMLVRGIAEQKGIRFGPFVSASSIRTALRILRRIFPWSDHRTPIISKTPLGKSHFHNKRCFNYQIGLCPGTCIGAITKKEYAKNIAHLKLFFRGQKKKIIRTLEKEMHAASTAEEFEKAEGVKRKIFALQHIQDVALIGKIEDEIMLPQQNKCAVIPAIAGITAHLSMYNKKSRIEGYDISNIGGMAAVGAMVVFINNKPKKSEYRLFNIKTIFKPNDIGMMKEVLDRRLKNTWPLPHLILVDGGAGQITAARKALDKAGVHIPIVGLAKGNDRKGNRFIGAVPDFTHKKTLIAVRDEAHRFSRAHHTRLRSRRFLHEERV